MGLDQYIFRVKSTEIPDSTIVDFEINSYTEQLEVAYWRKFPDLQGWMQKEYITAGGVNIDFNTCNIVVTLDLLKKLQHDIRTDKLEPTFGFFFGCMDCEKWIHLEDSIIKLMTLVKEDSGQHKFYYFGNY